jgi:sensor histidine kinase YesM
LTKKRPEDAERMTGLLIRFLRTAVPKNQGDMTTLGSELEAVDAYMEIMKIRMGARLTSTVEMEQSLAEVPFPPLLIQTLVENAIKHGLEPKVGPVTLSVTAKSNPEEGRISIEVIDNGVGLQNAPPSKGSGIGLKSVRERLQLLYGSKAELELSSTQDGGVSARIQLPLNHRD